MSGQVSPLRQTPPILCWPTYLFGQSLPQFLQSPAGAYRGSWNRATVRRTGSHNQATNQRVFPHLSTLGKVIRWAPPFWNHVTRFGLPIGLWLLRGWADSSRPPHTVRLSPREVKNIKHDRYWPHRPREAGVVQNLPAHDEQSAQPAVSRGR